MLCHTIQYIRVSGAYACDVSAMGASGRNDGQCITIIIHLHRIVHLINIAECAVLLRETVGLVWDELILHPNKSTLNCT